MPNPDTNNRDQQAKFAESLTPPVDVAEVFELAPSPSLDTATVSDENAGYNHRVHKACETDSKRIKLPTSLALIVGQILRDQYKIDYWKSRTGFDKSFTVEDLKRITKLGIRNPVPGSLEGIENLPNLSILTIGSATSDKYDNPKDVASLGSVDIASIEKCTNLRELSIVNQSGITELDLSLLTQLTDIDISRNSNLRSIIGIDKLARLNTVTCFGNNDTCEVDGICLAITQSSELLELKLDIHLFPAAIGYNLRQGSYSQEAIGKIAGLNKAEWHEYFPGNGIKINFLQMIRMHNKACEILEENVPRGSTRDTVVSVERYLAENVKYDDESLDNGRTIGVQMPNSNVRIQLGIKNGANSSYNCIVERRCICEGYTRGEQYLLRLRGIKARNVHCIAGEDKLGMASGQQDGIHSHLELPKEGYHGIICIEDYFSLYSDPTWNAAHYQITGDKTLPYTLLTKDEIAKTHTLTFTDRNVGNEHLKEPRSSIQDSLKRAESYVAAKSKTVSADKIPGYITLSEPHSQQF